MNMEAKPSHYVKARELDIAEAEPSGDAVETTASPGRRDGRVRRLVRTVVILAALGVAAYFTYPWLEARWTHVFLDDARIAGNLVAVSSEGSGRIATRSVIAGVRVARGQVLATLD